MYVCLTDLQITDARSNLFPGAVEYHGCLAPVLWQLSIFLAVPLWIQHKMLISIKVFTCGKVFRHLCPAHDCWSTYTSSSFVLVVFSDISKFNFLISEFTWGTKLRCWFEVTPGTLMLSRSPNYQNWNSVASILKFCWWQVIVSYVNTLFLRLWMCSDSLWCL